MHKQRTKEVESVEKHVEEKITNCDAKFEELNKSIDGLRDAVREQTKIIGELAVENKKWFRAGKM